MKCYKTRILVLAAGLMLAGCVSQSTDNAEAASDQMIEHQIIYGPSLIDAQGNTYATVIIGEQQWMAENLRVTQYSNGQPLDYPGANADLWSENRQGAYAWYDNDPALGEMYGALYNWYAVVSPNGLCPEGWRVPDQHDWQRLTEFAGSQMGNKLKSRRQVDSPFGQEFNTTEHPRWESFSQNYGEDLFGFAALPAGNRHASGTFVTLGANALFWSASEVSETGGFGWYMYHGYYGVDRGYGDKRAGFSLRCVKNIH